MASASQHHSIADGREHAIGAPVRLKRRVCAGAVETAATALASGNFHNKSAAIRHRGIHSQHFQLRDGELRARARNDFAPSMRKQSQLSAHWS